MDKIIITIGGLSLMAVIYWFFFGKKEEAVGFSTDQKILVEGGYKPDLIRLKKGKTATLKFIRKDTNSCLEDFFLPDFKIKKYLPLNKEIKVVLKPNKTGTFEFHCGMNMFHVKIIVEE